MDSREVRRGEIYAFDLSRHGFEKDRPVVILQNDKGNRYSSDTIDAPFRDIKGGKLLPIHVNLAKGTGGLKKDGVVDTGIVHTIPKAQLGPRIGSLPAEDMRRVDHALRISLGI